MGMTSIVESLGLNQYITFKEEQAAKEGFLLIVDDKDESVIDEIKKNYKLNDAQLKIVTESNSKYYDPEKFILVMTGKGLSKLGLEQYVNELIENIPFLMNLHQKITRNIYI